MSPAVKFIGSLLGLGLVIMGIIAYLQGDKDSAFKFIVMGMLISIDNKLDDVITKDKQAIAAMQKTYEEHLKNKDKNV